MQFHSIIESSFRQVALLAAAVVLSWLAAGCKPALPSGILSEGKMERVLYDYHLAQGIAEAGEREPGVAIEQYRYELLEAVCRKHGITQAELDSSLVYYCSDLESMNRIYRHVALRLEHDAEVYGAAQGPRDLYAELTSMGDTANVWADRPLMAIRAATKQNLQTWSLECDSTWMAGDDVLWRFQLMDIHVQGPGSLYADLIVEYDNDSVRARQQVLTSDATVELRLNADEGWTPRKLTGHLYQPLQKEGTHLYLAHHFVLIRFHKPEDVRRRYASDSLQADSLQVDTLRSDTLASDSLLPLKAEEHLMPADLRERQKAERTIQVVREKEYTPQRGRRRQPMKKNVRTRVP